MSSSHTASYVPEASSSPTRVTRKAREAMLRPKIVFTCTVVLSDNDLTVNLHLEQRYRERKSSDGCTIEEMNSMLQRDSNRSQLESLFANSLIALETENRFSQQYGQVKAHLVTHMANRLRKFTANRGLHCEVEYVSEAPRSDASTQARDVVRAKDTHLSLADRAAINSDWTALQIPARTTLVIRYWDPPPGNETSTLRPHRIADIPYVLIPASQSPTESEEDEDESEEDEET